MPCDMPWAKPHPIVVGVLSSIGCVLDSMCGRTTGNCIYWLAAPHCPTGREGLLCSVCHVSCPTGLRACWPLFVGFLSLPREPEISPSVTPFPSLIYVHDFSQVKISIHKPTPPWQKCSELWPAASRSCKEPRC